MQSHIESVSLQIRLITHVQSMFVTQIIEARMIRVVARANCVEIISLHHDHIMEHRLFGHRLTVFWTVLVAVDTLNNNRFLVHAKPLTKYLYCSNSDTTRLDV